MHSPTSPLEEDESQYAPPCIDISQTVREKGLPHWPYRAAIKQALISEAIILILAALILDGGRSLRICFIAALGHFATVAILMCRRPRSPTRFDLAFIRYGFWFLMLVTWVACLDTE